MREAAIRCIERLAEQDRNVILLSGDLGYGVLDNFRKNFPEQYFNMGICEQNMASVAAGLALEGKRIYTYSIGNFPTLRCIEQIRNDICYHDVDVKIVAVGGGLAYGSLGMSHHATEDIAMMRSLPGMMVFAPADSLEAKAVMQEVAKTNKPCYIRLNKGGEPNIHKSDEELGEYQLGKALKLSEGHDVCILATGAISIEAVRAGEMLRTDGIKAEIYSFPSIKPIDKEVVLDCARRYPLIYTIEEHNVMGGFGSTICETITENGNGARVIRIGLVEQYSSRVGSQQFLRHAYEMDAETITARIKNQIKN